MPRKTPDEIYAEAIGRKTPDEIYAEATAGKGKVRAVDMPPMNLKQGFSRALFGQPNLPLGLDSPPQPYAVQPNIPQEEAERMNQQAFQEQPLPSALGKEGQVESPGFVGTLLNPFEMAAIGGAGAITAKRFGKPVLDTAVDYATAGIPKGVTGFIEGLKSGLRGATAKTTEKTLKHIPRLPGGKEAAEAMASQVPSTGVPLGVSSADEMLNQSVEKFYKYLKKAKPVRKELEREYHIARAKGAGKLEKIFKESEGLESYYKALASQKGPLADKPKFESLMDMMGQDDINNLFKAVHSHGDLLEFEKLSASNGLFNILEGRIPPNSQLSMLEDIFGSKMTKEVYKKRALGHKLRDFTTEAFNIPRAMMTSFDMSAPLRQGVIFTTTKPVTATRAFREMFRQVFSPKNFDDWLNATKKLPEYEPMNRSGLYISEPHKIAGGLSAKEEAFMTNIAQKIPIIGKGIQASERAYVGFLNKMRVDVFNNISKKFIKDGLDPKADARVFESLAEFINTATGRGGLGRAGPLAQDLNTWFFSPRLIAARFQMLNINWYRKQPWPVRKEAIKSMTEFIGVGSTLLALAKAGGMDVETDMRSTDFGKIRFGDTRWDIWGGFQQWVRTIAQIATAQRKTASGQIRNISGEEFPFTPRTGEIIKFLRNKLAPVPGLTWELIDGQKMYGGDITLKGEAMNKMVAMYIQDIYDASQDWGPSALFTVGVPAWFGVGVQHYKPKSKTETFGTF
jgi:hypothetical protein